MAQSQRHVLLGHLAGLDEVFQHRAALGADGGEDLPRHAGQRLRQTAEFHAVLALQGGQGGGARGGPGVGGRLPGPLRFGGPPGGLHFCGGRGGAGRGGRKQGVDRRGHGFPLSVPPGPRGLNP
ncbi:hypothetical protein D3869_04290 [Azospirillum brasilense]|uniref:Uncharacterized protein n=1 Tax=Azospirillum brasilense TaxID=192 RepID=A0A4D8QUQ7_AZOBR|nr:hypothetical protein D3869_04290 [Azospirillum brasilense]